ncbi:MAG: hypothetical protein ACLUPL_10115 [Butyricimonas virosa]
MKKTYDRKVTVSKDGGNRGYSVIYGFVTGIPGVGKCRDEGFDTVGKQAGGGEGDG